jgi:Mg2+ and Co2+ transporter CorA
MDKHKMRITPLNFATAFFLLLAVYVSIYGINVTGGHRYPYALKNWMFTAIFILFAIVVSFMDLILRNFFRETKKLWIVELSFITLAIVLFLLAK